MLIRCSLSVRRLHRAVGGAPRFGGERPLWGGPKGPSGFEIEGPFLVKGPPGRRVSNLWRFARFCGATTMAAHPAVLHASSDSDEARLCGLQAFAPALLAVTAAAAQSPSASAAFSPMGAAMESLPPELLQVQAVTCSHLGVENRFQRQALESDVHTSGVQKCRQTRRHTWIAAA